MSHPPIRKALGQHFLHQRRVIDAIVQRFAPCPEDVVVEIGPGRGALTEVLAPRVAALHAVELDRELAAQLSAKMRDCPNLFIHRQDALRFDHRALGARVRVIGNLPYNISTPLLFALLDQAQAIRDMCLMLQKEVADRILARPGSRTYGRLSVMVQQRCRAELLLTVAPGAFTPPPRVQSAVLALVPECPPPYPAYDPEHFTQVVRQAFAQRRKTLRNALKGVVSEAQMAQCGIRSDSRAEQLSVAQFACLANAGLSGNTA